jgi:hypothetical protein
MTNKKKLEKLLKIKSKANHYLESDKDGTKVIPILNFKLVDIDSEIESSIIFSSIDEATSILKDSGIISSREEIHKSIKKQVGDIDSDFKLNFYSLKK